jgi:hypothetical protein
MQIAEVRVTASARRNELARQRKFQFEAEMAAPDEIENPKLGTGA